MFWRFGGYSTASAIDTILDKPDFALEELLDEGDLLQEIKQRNSKLVEYLRQDHILERLLDYVIAPKLAPVGVNSPESEASEEEEKEKERSGNRLLPFSRPRAVSKPAEPEEDEQENKRNRYAYMSAEVLASETWSIYEALMESPYLVRNFWRFLQRDAPLDPLQASYFTKVNEALFEKKTYAMVELFMSMPDSVSDLLKHVECPMIMDLLLKIIAMERHEAGQGIVEWLHSQGLMQTLISFLSPDQDWVVQTAASDFIKAIITLSANATQNDQICIGPNELTRQLVSKPCVEQLIGYMLSGGNALTTGVSIVIEVIRKNNSDYDPDVCSDANARPSSRDPIFLGTLLRLFAENVPNFMALMANVPVQHLRLDSTFGDKIEPLGFDRFKTCELMAELLHCSNMGLLNEVGAEDAVAARDAERQRLRVEGKLSPPRGGEDAPPAIEDLTLRSSHSPESGRRLGIANMADDDGFEEVEHSGEMNEDTSHEFVKAEEEITALPLTSLSDKDDDDFVDEPLSSPRMRPRDGDGGGRPRFEMPELVVAPLSPKKKAKDKAEDEPEDEPEDVSLANGMEAELSTPNVESEEESAPPVEPKDEESHGAEPSLESLVEKLDIKDEATPLQAPSEPVEAKEGPKEEPKEEPKESHPEDASSTSSTTPAAATEPKEEVEQPAAEMDEASSSDAPAVLTSEKAPAGADERSEDLVPHPDDMPEPLFSPRKSSLTEEPPEPLGGDFPIDFPNYSAAGIGENDSGMPDSSTFLAGPPAPEDTSRPQAIPQASDPVVGDLMKMQFVTHEVVPTILSFFFRYPWNNFLHNVVYDIIQQVFNGPMDRGYNPSLAISLFDDAADITMSIVKGQAASDEYQAKTKTRLGYMGHLTLIAEEVVKFTDRHPPEMLSDMVMDKVMSSEWIDYVEGSLAETRERDNAILGGVRPDMAMNHNASLAGNALAAVGLSNAASSAAVSNALAEAGLNGAIESNEGSGNGIGPFAISSGTLTSGFGSSSDEEDEEGEDHEEDVNNEFRAYTDPSSSLLSPPSVPPPPPPAAPLNVPPSRARLQLSAQLAKRKKNEAAAAAATKDPDTHKSDDDDMDLRDPFADDEEVEDVDSDDDDDAGIGGHSWGNTGRGSWWRDVVRRRRPEDDNDNDNSDDDDDDEDEEFGEFAMPEVDTVACGIPSDSSKLFKPLAVHPPQSTSPNASKSTFSGIWPFSTQGFGSPGGLSVSAATTDGDPAKQGSPGRRDSEVLQVDQQRLPPPPPPRSEDGREVDSVVEAKRRTSIEDPDDEDDDTVTV